MKLLSEACRPQTENGKDVRISAYIVRQCAESDKSSVQAGDALINLKVHAHEKPPSCTAAVAAAAARAARAAAQRRARGTAFYLHLCACAD